MRRAVLCALLSACALFPSLDDLSGGDAASDVVQEAAKDVAQPDVVEAGADVDADAGNQAPILITHSLLMFGPSYVGDAGLSAFTSKLAVAPGVGANPAIVVGINLSSASCQVLPAVTSVTDDHNQSYVHFQSAPTTGAGCPGGETVSILEVWRAVGVAVGPTQITITYASPPPYVSYVSFGAIAFTGVSQATPLRNAASTSQQGGPASITEPVTSVPGDVVSEIICNGTTGPQPANGQTLRWGADSGSTYCASSGAATFTATAATYDDTWNVANDFTSILAFDVVRAP
jgi:hypothetical protein